MEDSKEIIIITGSTDGIGLHTAQKLALLKDKIIIIHGRNKD
jgi:NAD(P)-dependent dehydrogenase (short-subunit alcohol dehydrogenase family)